MPKCRLCTGGLIFPPLLILQGIFATAYGLLILSKFQLSTLSQTHFHTMKTLSACCEPTWMLLPKPCAVILQFWLLGSQTFCLCHVQASC